MLDPITALSLAGNIVQFVDFSIRVLGDAHELHKSAEGSLQENLDVETVAGTIRILQMKLRIQDNHNISGDGKAENLLEGLCTSCDETAKELLEVLEKLKVQGKKSPWKSIRQAIKSIKGKADIAEICARLNRFRETLELTILVDLRQKLDLQSVANSDSFKNLEISSQNIVLAVLQNRSIFTTAIDAQSVELKEAHQKEVVVAALRHEDVKSTLLATVEDMSKLQSHEHRITRQEIAQRAACDAANLKVHMDKCTEEMTSLIIATSRAKGAKQRVRLKEKANAEILAKNNLNYGGQSWKLESYQSKENTNGRQEQGSQIPQPATKCPIWGLQETSPTPEITSRSSVDSSSSYSSLSPSDSRSTMPDTRGNQFEFEAMGAEPQHAHPPNPFSAYPRHQMSPNVSYSESDYRRPTFPSIPPTMYPGMSSTPQYGPHCAPRYRGYDPPIPGYDPQQYALHWPPSEPSVIGPPAFDPEIEKKLMVLDDMMRNQKLKAELVQKELAERETKYAEAKASAEAAKRAAEEREAWEKKLENEKKAVLAAYMAAQKGAAEERAQAEAKVKAEVAKKVAEETAALEKKFRDHSQAFLATCKTTQKAAAEESAETAMRAAEEKPRGIKKWMSRKSLGRRS
ncbi:uncharacterized protein PAC_17713 [Phialocephala subalpina]|uniref:Fungal N-terminal domain-containing protein n=1 Tax=Phialocephala subalpina TaxID=576137 RepID=A0A1L7XRY7_9HELO|nr:uncharacterized protein PAC_17713 [Phialocephala subalpina]